MTLETCDAIANEITALRERIAYLETWMENAGPETRVVRMAKAYQSHFEKPPQIEYGVADFIGFRDSVARAFPENGQ